MTSGEQIMAPINIRPYAVEWLHEVSQFCEVVVFTASHPWYADAVLDYLDPDNVMVHHRLYRDDCVSLEGVHVKDLRVIANRDLADIVLIDNAAYSFAY